MKKVNPKRLLTTLFHLENIPEMTMGLFKYSFVNKTIKPLHGRTFMKNNISFSKIKNIVRREATVLHLRKAGASNLYVFSLLCDHMYPLETPLGTHERMTVRKADNILALVGKQC